MPRDTGENEEVEGGLHARTGTAWDRRGVAAPSGPVLGSQVLPKSQGQDRGWKVTLAQGSALQRTLGEAWAVLTGISTQAFPGLFLLSFILGTYSAFIEHLLCPGTEMGPGLGGNRYRR